MINSIIFYVVLLLRGATEGGYKKRTRRIHLSGNWGYEPNCIKWVEFGPQPHDKSSAAILMTLSRENCMKNEIITINWKLDNCHTQWI